MNFPFIYDRYVINKDFTGRKSECLALSSLLGAGENIAIFEPPKSGKKSLIQQTLFEMRLAGANLNVAILPMFNIRCTKDFLTGFGNVVIRSIASSPDEYNDIISRHLEGTGFSFNAERFAEADEVVTLENNPTPQDMSAMFTLPYRLGADTGIKMIVILDEFQTVSCMKEERDLLKAMENVMRKQKEEGSKDCCYILSGSKVNAMKDIFCVRKYFYRTVEHLPLNTVNERDLDEHIRKGFLKGGKEIEKEQVTGICHLFKGNIWYINHFSAICDSLSKGYINEGIMMDALNALISIHEMRFMEMTDSLTEHQIHFLKAVLDGVTRFSSSEIIEKYGLNSSANVKRVKDALMKKEILTFNEKDEPIILDPLFEYWVRKYYFEKA